jgi:glyoxylase-like metal-dependent hydrolase (beta-lactamase superfamily II)
MGGKLRVLAAAGLAALAMTGAAMPSVAWAQQGFGDAKLSEANLKPVGPHTYVIMGFPNIGLVVGDKAILVVDTGLGNANGATITAIARKLATKGQRLILTTTHFHPEHAAGQGGFPAGTQVIRPRVQQEEMDKEGAGIMAAFSRAEAMKPFMQDAALIKADTLFDTELDLDLGDVHARLLWFGPAHTRGDEIVYVPEDSLILPGDVIENRISPNIICDTCSPRKWIAVIDQIAKLNPDRVVPDHGELGDSFLIGEERAFLANLDAQAVALKAQGVPADEAGRRIQAQFEKIYQRWQGLGNIPQSVQRAYADPRQ